MDADFWHWIWDRGMTGFHQPEADAFLVRHLPAFGLTPGSVVFVPLCGKTLDLGWLRTQGYQAVGVELSQIAVDQVFDGLGVVPEVTKVGKLVCHTIPGLRVLTGDIFDLTAEVLGPVALTFDRAALFALPAGLRPGYAAHVTTITHGAPQLLVSLVYDQGRMRGPPFAVRDDEVLALYTPAYAPLVLERQRDEGDITFEDVVWRLT